MRQARCFQFVVKRICSGKWTVRRSVRRITCARLYSLAIGPWGLAICYDVEFPELIRAYALAGADIVLVPTANMLPYIGVATRVVPTRAEENEIYVAYANRVGIEGTFEYCGLSCVTGPDGNDAARASSSEEMIFAVVSKNEIRRVRSSLSHIKDRRIDLYPSGRGKSGSASISTRASK